MKIIPANVHSNTSTMPVTTTAANASAPNNSSPSNSSTSISSPIKDQLTLTHGKSNSSNFVHYNSEGRAYTPGEAIKQMHVIVEDEACCEVDDEVDDVVCCDVEEDISFDVEEDTCCDIDDASCYDLEDGVYTEDMDEACCEAQE